jgi:hypothetical protein
MYTIIPLNSFRYHRWRKLKKKMRSEKTLDKAMTMDPKVENVKTDKPEPDNPIERPEAK